jgi:hypothetical protein
MMEGYEAGVRGRVREVRVRAGRLGGCGSVRPRKKCVDVTGVGSARERVEIGA